METRNRSSYPDSPHPGDGHQSDWIAKPYSIVLTGVVLFILIFGIAIFQGWRQVETTRHNNLTADKTTANLLADLIQEHNKATIGILQSYAYRPLFIAAVKNKDLTGAHRHLSDLKKNHEIDLTFVTDTRGILWTNFPMFPEAIGKDLSSRDWYKGISSHWKPYTSNVFKLIVGDKPLAVAVCVPIFDEKERPIGILGDTQRLGFLVDTIERVPFSPYTTVNVIDRAGHILYSNKFPYQEDITDYQFFPSIEPALKEKKQQIEINDPQKDQEESYLTVVPVSDIGWTVIIERSLKDIYRSNIRRFIEIGVISLLLFLLISGFLVYLRKVSLFRKTEELLQAEVKLRQGDEMLWLSEEKFAKAFQSSPDAFLLTSVPDGRITEVNAGAILVSGYSMEEMLGRTTTELGLWADPAARDAYMAEILREGRAVNFETGFRIKSGAIITGLISGEIIQLRDGKCFLSVIRDITERKRAEESLRESEEKYRNILESMNDSYFETDLRGNMTFCNPMVPKSLGYSPEEMAGMNHRVYMDTENAEIVEKNFRDIYRENIPSKVISYEVVRKDRTKAHIETSLSLIKNKDGHSIGYRGISRDITERKEAEEALKESENKYRLLADNVNDVIFVLDMNLNYTYISPSVKVLRGYEPKEVLIQKSIEKTLTPSSQELAMRTYSEIMDLEKSEHRDINMSRTLQLEMVRKDGTTVWTEVKFSFIRDEDQRPVGILGLTRDITERKRTEEELQRTLESLRKAFGATIQVMVSAVETRDPYTSGHQIRSADLARAIATEMGLPREKIDGIRMAGNIHDIGKLSIPAEILSKPKKLTEIEFSLIKEHSRKGYEMLKDVESPWPLAEIVYQHHERMDGSGYPRQLKGNDILMEARILAVADVVESMASHRPYRPALGIEAALEEIEKNRGIFYDKAVADACLRLFRERGFQLEG